MLVNFKNSQYFHILKSIVSLYYKVQKPTIMVKKIKDKKAEIVEDVEKPQKKVKNTSKKMKNQMLFLDTFKQ